MTLRAHALCASSFKRTLLLLTGVSSVAFISGCADVKNPFGSAHPDQHVTGERRLPIYNKPTTAAPAQQANSNLSAALAAPMVVTPAQKTADPYDYYNASTTPPAMPPAVAPSTSSDSMGTLNPSPVKAVRKPLPQNPSASVVTPATTTTTTETITNTSLQPTPAPMDATPEAAPAAEAAPSRPSFFERMFGSGKTDNSAKTEAASANNVSDAERNAPYASLSSVPAAPQEFKDVKASRQQDIQALQDDHGNAAQQKQLLVNEPSERTPSTPVNMPAKAESVNTAIMPLAAASEKNPGGARKPVRGVDIMTQDEWNAMQNARKNAVMQEQAPQSSLTPPAEPEPQLQARAPYWYENWGTAMPKTKEIAAPAVAKNEAPLAEPAIAPAPEALAQDAPVEAPAAQVSANNPPGQPGWTGHWLTTPPDNTETVATPVAQQQPAVLQPAADITATSSDSAAPKLMGQMSDHEMMQLTSPVKENAAANIPDAPASEPVKTAAELLPAPEDKGAQTAAEAASNNAAIVPPKKTSFFNRLFSSDKPAPEAVTPAPQMGPAPVAAAAPVAKVITNEDAAPASQTDTAVNSDTNSDNADATNASTLPPTQMLQQVKTLPASRYSVRSQSGSVPPQNY